MNIKSMGLILSAWHAQASRVVNEQPGTMFIRRFLAQSKIVVRNAMFLNDRGMEQGHCEMDVECDLGPVIVNIGMRMLDSGRAVVSSSIVRPSGEPRVVYLCSPVIREASGDCAASADWAAEEALRQIALVGEKLTGLLDSYHAIWYKTCP